jgi:tRNA-2-methylthio-N6-dimethylallyladenosine synthase
MGITSDIISGFPGETEEDFQESLSLIREVQFDQAYIYKYSERRDTPAVKMPNQVPMEVREERNARMLQVLNEVAAKRYESLVGHQVEVLVEGPSKRNPKRLSGRTRCNKIVVFEGEQSHVGKILRLEIARSGSFTLYGVPPAAE